MVKVLRVRDRITLLKLVLGEKIFYVISIYTPRVSLSEQGKMSLGGLR